MLRRCWICGHRSSRSIFSRSHAHGPLVCVWCCDRLGKRIAPTEAEWNAYDRRRAGLAHGDGLWERGQ